MDQAVFDSALRLVLGAIVLLAGRNIFWLFVGVIGFLLGFEFAGMLLTDPSPISLLLVGIAAGLIGAVLAIVWERVAFALAGFYALAFFAMALSTKLDIAPLHPLVVAGAGVAGAVVAALLMDWAIIVLSALAGAAAIVTAITTNRPLEVLLFLGLAGLGIAVQRTVLIRRRP